MEFILFIVVVVLLFWIAAVSNRVSVLERKLKENSIHSQPVNYAPPVQTNRLFAQEPQSSAEFHPISMPMPMPEAPKEALKVPKTSAQEAEDAVNWLNRIGVVALVLGMGFFLKIAIDLGWIGPWGQIFIAVATGGLLVYLGHIWQGRFGERALALSGGGVAVLYFSIFAAFNFYHLVPQVLAFICMVAIAAFAVWLSYKNSSLALGALAFFGAYGAPLLYSSGQEHQIVLFLYLSVINISALVVMFRKYWNQLLILTIVGTIVDFAIWASMSSNYQNTLGSVTFIIITSLIYAVGSSALVRFHNSKQSLPRDFENNVSALAIVNGAFYFIAIFTLLYSSYHDILPAVALLGSVIFFFAYAVVDRLNFRNLNFCLSFVASVLIVFAAIWKFDGKALASAFLLLGLLGSSVGVLVKKEELRVWGIIVLFLALFKSLVEPYAAGDNTFLFNAKFGLMFANTLALLFVGWMYQKIEASESEKNVEKALQVIAAIVLWGIVSWDIFFPGHSVSNADNFMTLWWVIYPVVLSAVGLFSRREELAKVAIVLLAASFFKVLFVPYSGDYEFLYNIKFGLMALEAGALLVVAQMYQKASPDKEFPDALKVVASLLLWFAVSWEIVKYFENDVSKNARNLYLSLWWIAYSAVLMGAGIMWRSPLFRKISLGLFFITIAKVFLFDLLSLDLGYLIVSFISLGVILIGVSFFYRKNKQQITNFLEGEIHKDIHE